MNIERKAIKVGSRASRLAAVQVEEVCALLQKHGIRLDVERVTLATAGDKDKTTSLTDTQVKDDFFTDTLDAALLEGKIDLAVHSAKDLPKKMRQGLDIFGCGKGGHPRDYRRAYKTGRTGCL